MKDAAHASDGASTHAASTHGASTGRSWMVLFQAGRPPQTIELETDVTIGRYVGQAEIDGHVVTHDDPTVSRLHAVVTPRPLGWCVQATAARNGLFVNGVRLAPGAVHLLASGDELRLGDRTTLAFHSHCGADDDRSMTATARPVPELTAGELRVLLCLCAPVLSGDAFTPPAGVAAIAAELVVSESAVKQQLGRLYLKFEVPEGADRRVRLANEALTRGAVRRADLQALRGRR